MATHHRHFCRFAWVILIFSLIYDADSRIHKLDVKMDIRSNIDMSTFGFLKGGHMIVNMVSLSVGKSSSGDKVANNTMGFTLEKTMSLGLSSDSENSAIDCPLQRFDSDKNESVIYFILDLDHKPPLIHVKRRGDLSHLNISLERLPQPDDPTEPNTSDTRRRRSLTYLSDSYLMVPVPQYRIRQRRDTNEGTTSSSTSSLTSSASSTTSSQKPQTSSSKFSSTSPPSSTSNSNKSLTTSSTSSVSSPGSSSSNQPSSKTQPSTTSNQSSSKTPSSTTSDKSTPSKAQSSATSSEQKSTEENPSEPETKEKEKEKDNGEKGQEKKGKADTSGTGSNSEAAVTMGPILLTNNSIPVKKTDIPGNDVYSFYFVLWITTDAEEGLYNFFFHNCRKGSSKRAVNFTMDMREENVGNYLSAGEMPLPTLYFVLCLVHLGLACMWLYILRTSEEGVYKLHYLMLALLFVKALALLFHGLNYYFIQEEGQQEEAFAVLYYITYLMRGMLLFVTILLIGAGWAFIKHVLSSREKRIFIIVIPLQILSNVAQIIIEETEEGNSEYQVWKEILIAVDLICCGAILFPVVWSIRHLQWASQTDGKAAINLQKLKLFRHFYIMIVCYIYFSRIIVILVNITVPFRYEWIQELFKEVTTLVFFVFTGVKFRPASNNPYLQVPSDDEEDDLEMDSVVTGHSGLLEGVTRVNQSSDNSVPAGAGAAGADVMITGPKQREASHEYD